MKGNIAISEGALISLMGLAAHEVPGVVGMAPVNIREGILKILGRTESGQGVVLTRGKDGLGYTADLCVIVAYGVSIPQVGQSIVERVENAMETIAGLKMTQITVHVVGVSHG
ncbi:MAG: Asp23/Gls24 family envelope stress response protein [Deinococcaceae bacterium]